MKMELVFIPVGLVLGVIGGVTLPFNRSIMISLGLVVMNMISLVGLFPAMLTLGYFISSFLVNMAKKDDEAYNQCEDFSQGNLASRTKLFRGVGSYKVQNFLVYFIIACVAFFIFPSGAHTNIIMMFVSLIIVFFMFGEYVFDGAKGTIRRVIAILLIFGCAKMAVTSKIFGWSTMGYFTSIMTLPGLIKTKEEEVEERKATLLDSATFANSAGLSLSTVYGAIVLAQSIVWGSQKDTLGTMLNIIFPAAFESYRVILALVVGLIIFIALLAIIAFYGPGAENKDNSVFLKLLSFFLIGVNLYFMMVNLGIAHSILQITLGLLSNKLMNPYHVRQFSIPALLIVGMLSN